MKNEDVLKLAIKKAVKNGWTDYGQDDVYLIMMHYSNGLGKKDKTFGGLAGNKYYEIVFSHDFAKAFWGEEEICPDCGKKEECYCTNLDLYMFPRKEKEWEFHLQVMVLEKDPIQYLKEFL